MFISQHAGDALWSVAVDLAVAWLLPGLPAVALFSVTLGISFGVGLPQFLDRQWLFTHRGTRFGPLFLGSGFQWLDFPGYPGGALLALDIDSF